MTSLASIKNSKKRKKIKNFPTSSISPIKKTDNKLKSKNEKNRLKRRQEQKSTETQLLEVFSKKWIQTKELRELENETGLKYKRGKFSRLEEKLRAGVMRYLKYNNKTEEEFREAIVEGIRENKSALGKFCVELTQELPGRPVITVYHYLRRLYHPGNKQGSWLPEEDMHLRRLFAIHGPQWQIIAKELGRYNNSCRDRYRFIRQQYHKGPWTSDEVTRLRNAVCELTSCKKDSGKDKEGVGAWASISEMVQTRNWHQCLVKWTYSLAFWEKHSNQKVIRWTKEQDLILLNRIYDLVVEDESEIVWSRLLDESWNCWTSNRLRTRWQILKKRVNLNKGVHFNLDSLVETLINSMNSLSPDKLDSEIE